MGCDVGTYLVRKGLERLGDKDGISSECKCADRMTKRC